MPGSTAVRHYLLVDVVLLCELDARADPGKCLKPRCAWFLECRRIARIGTSPICVVLSVNSLAWGRSHRVLRELSRLLSEHPAAPSAALLSVQSELTIVRRAPMSRTRNEGAPQDRLSKSCLLREGITAPRFQISADHTTARRRYEQASKYEDSLTAERG